jgi:hypothetical protein
MVPFGVIFLSASIRRYFPKLSGNNNLNAIWSDWQAAYAVYGRLVCHRRRGLKSGDYGDN